MVLFIHSLSINLFNLIHNITKRKLKRVLGPELKAVSVRWRKLQKDELRNNFVYQTLL